MSADLVLEYSSGGGAPPANSESLRINKDGGVVYIVGNALAAGEPMDQAGLYQMRLPPADLADIENSVSESALLEMRENYGPVRADSGFSALRLFKEGRAKNIGWGPFAKTPQSLDLFVSRLNPIIQSARSHPSQVLSAELIVQKDGVQPGKSFVELVLKSLGDQPVRIHQSALSKEQAITLRLYAKAAADSPEQIVPLSYYRSSAAVEQQDLIDLTLESPFELRRGNDLIIRGRAPFTINDSVSQRLYGFVEATVDLDIFKSVHSLECLIATRPLLAPLLPT